MTVSSLSLCARLTLDLHSLNNEGTEGNQQQTRMVHIIDQRGRRAVVNGISGDMFKHILVEHLVPLLDSAAQPLSPGARAHDADRINALNQVFVDFCEKEQEFVIEGKKQRRKAMESEILARMLRDCSLTDIAGALVTRGRSVGRKSVVEFGWVVGLPEDRDGQPLTTTEQYFHVKYAPEGRGAAAGDDTVAGRQAIFHRPASSGVYALICNLDLYRIGLNDITRRYEVDGAGRRARGQALIHALAATLLKPIGAQRNTQNPHIVACEGAVAVSSVSLPAPTVSPLNDGTGRRSKQSRLRSTELRTTASRCGGSTVSRRECGRSARSPRASRSWGLERWLGPHGGSLSSHLERSMRRGSSSWERVRLSRESPDPGGGSSWSITRPPCSRSRSVWQPAR